MMCWQPRYGLFENQQYDSDQAFLQNENKTISLINININNLAFVVIGKVNSDHNHQHHHKKHWKYTPAKEKCHFIISISLCYEQRHKVVFLDLRYNKLIQTSYVMRFYVMVKVLVK